MRYRSNGTYNPWMMCLINLSSLLFLIGIDGALIRQRYDGWSNNQANPDWGSVGSALVHKVPAAFADLTYKMAGRRRPNPRDISNNVLSGPSGLPSYSNKTLLFVFTGQLIAMDVVSTSEASCPIELVRVPVPSNDSTFRDDGPSMPFTRSKFDSNTGQSPNNPRRPLNGVSSWLDMNFLYGSDEVWSNCLRQFSGGRLLAQNSTPSYPGYNTIGLPLETTINDNNQSQKQPQQYWMFGTKNGHQTPPLTAQLVMWFRYHNHIAAQIEADHPRWRDEMIFQTTRRRVVATWQNIVFNEWLPALLGEMLPGYTGYKSYIHPGVSTLFSSAFRFGHSMIPAGFYIRNGKCEYRKPNNQSAMRLCNCYWGAQKILEKYGLDEVLLGMASQIAEREDHIMNNDLRNKIFRHMQHSHHDLAVLNILRGRDHGLPDYNTARKNLALPEVHRFEDINPQLARNDPTVFDNLRKTYKDRLDDIDVYAAGLIEFSESGPGPLFRNVIMEQFLRIRDADRFWFENEHSGLFTSEEINVIKNVTLNDVILAVTDIDPQAIQKDVMHWKDGDPCPQPEQQVAHSLDACSPHTVNDIFAGNEMSFILGFSSIFFFPIVCITLAWLIYKTSKLKWNVWWDKKLQQLIARNEAEDLEDLPKPRTERRNSIHSINSAIASKCRSRRGSNASSISLPTYIYATEWLGKSQPARSIKIDVDEEECSITLMSISNHNLRKISFRKYDEVEIWLSEDKNRTVFMCHIPKGVDLVLQFSTELERAALIKSIKKVLKLHDKYMVQHACLEKYIYERSVTKERRQDLLTKFFKGVFAEAYKLEQLAPEEKLHTDECKDIADCELTREEFAEALSLTQDATFVSQMFSLIDKDNKGYISFRDMIYTVALFTKGSVEDKLHLLFLMYDVNRSGSLSQEEVTKMIRSMIEMGQSKLSRDEIDQLVEQTLCMSGLSGKEKLMFEDFQAMLAPNLQILNNVSLEWKGTKANDRNQTRTAGGQCEPGRLINRKMSRMIRRPSTIFRIELEGNSRFAAKMIKIRHFIENKRQHIVYVFLFFCINAGLFIERFYRYSVEREHSGFRSLMGYGLSLTRGCAASMSFSFSLLLLTMCRNLITALRDTFINLYVPFDSHIAFHKLVAVTALVFTVLHVIGYGFNFYHLATQPAQFLCVFPEVALPQYFTPTFLWWMYGNSTGLTGYILTFIISIIFIFSTQTARKYIFNAFWMTHKLFYIVYILTIIHGLGKIVQDPFFPWYFLGPGLIFILDKVVSLSRKKRVIDIVKADLLPSGVTLIEFKRPSNFEYKSGQWVRLACVDLGKNEYHPLTLTSAPQEDTLSVHIRAVGPWTNNFRSMLDPQNLAGKPYPKLYLDGPFGAGQQDWFRYDISVLVGGGIGITPYASILKDFVHMNSGSDSVNFKFKCKKVYFLWVTGSQKQWEWFIDILRQAESVDKNNTVEPHIFITQFFTKFDLRTTMLYICEEHFQVMTNKSMFTGLRAMTHFGRPNFHNIFKEIARKYPKTRNVGVFSCGPTGLTKGVEKACQKASADTKALFQHHFENF